MSEETKKPETKKPFDLRGRKVDMFRCHLDPAIGPKPMNAFTRKAFPHAAFELTPIGIHVHLTITKPGTNEIVIEEHIVPYANVQSIKLVQPDKE